MSQLSNAINAALESRNGEPYLHGARTIKYREMRNHVCAMSTVFVEAGLKDKRVILVTQDDLSLLASFFGALCAGVTAVVLDPKAPKVELKRLIKAAEASAIVADEKLLEVLDSTGSLHDPATIISVSPEYSSSARRNWPFFRASRSKEGHDYASLVDRHRGAGLCLSDVSERDIAYILFTSGTTSKPKGVMISHGALFAQMCTFKRNYGFDTNSTIMNLLPLHHTDGLTQGAVVTLLSEATLVRPYRFSLDVLPQMVNDLYRKQVTHLVTVPSVLALIDSLGEQYSSAFDYAEFDFIISTAAYLDPDLWERFEKRFAVQVVNVYGLTETVCESMYCGPSLDSRRLGSVGKPVDAEAKIVDECGAELDVNQSGELLLRGSHIMSGYYKMPEETAAVLTGDGWFRTGDLAKRDPDGFYWIVGRKKDLIITAGMNVYPEDVNTVLRSTPGVMDAVTFGVPDPTWGEKVVSCVLAKPGEKPDKESVVADFLSKASRSKLPKEIHILDEFPRGPAGKVVVSEIRRIVEMMTGPQGDTGVSGAFGHDELALLVIDLAANTFQCHAQDLKLADTPETVPGWTSIAHVELLLAIEKAFETKFSAHEVMKLTSLGSTVEVLRERKTVSRIAS